MSNMREDFEEIFSLIWNRAQERQIEQDAKICKYLKISSEWGQPVSHTKTYNEQFEKAIPEQNYAD